MASWAELAKATDCVCIRDCQTQTLSQTDIEVAMARASENEENHQREPEASVSRDKREGKDCALEEDQSLMTGSDEEGERKPTSSIAGKGTSPGTSPGSSPGQHQERDPKEEQMEIAKKIGIYVAGFAGGAVAIAIGSFIAAPFILAGMGFTTAGIAAGSVGASMMSASAIASGGGIAAGSTVALLQSAGAAGGIAAGTCAGLGIGSAAAITGLVAAGEVAVSAVRYKKKPKNGGQATNDAGTQTDSDSGSDSH